jgi:hypothetical protein
MNGFSELVSLAQTVQGLRDREDKIVNKTTLLLFYTKS